MAENQRSHNEPSHEAQVKGDPHSHQGQHQNNNQEEYRRLNSYKPRRGFQRRLALELRQDSLNRRKLFKLKLEKNSTIFLVRNLQSLKPVADSGRLSNFALSSALR
jgi:hypothetical protein